MTPRLLDGAAGLAALGAGLVGGTFFAFSAFVMPALARLPAPHGAAAMNAVNAAVLRSAFLPVFGGTALVCAALAVAALRSPDRPGSRWLLAGSLLYLVGGFGVTALKNVPLNEALAAAPDPAGAWASYTGPWTAWNTIRAVACALSVAALVAAVREG